MWQPEEIEIVNLFTHKHTKYKFLKNKAVLIYGKNLTDTGADSNGSGKSGLLEGITLAATGATCREVDKEQFINDSEDFCEVTWKLSNKIGNINSLEIYRRYTRGNKPAKIILSENGIVNEQITSVNEANSRIFELIGISREDLLNYFIIGQNSNHSFFTCTDGEKKNIIARLTNAEIIDKVLANITLKKKALSDLKISAEADIQKTNNFIEFNQEQLVHEKDFGKKEKQEEIALIKEEIVEKEDEINEIKDSIENKLKEDKTLEKRINELKTLVVPTDKLEAKTSSIKKEINAFELEVREANKLETQLNRELGGKVACPKCKNEFIPDSDYTPKTINETIEQCKSVIKHAEDSIEECKERIKKIQKQVDLTLIVKRDMENQIGERNINQSKIHIKRKELKEEEERLKKLEDKLVIKVNELKNDTKILQLKANISKHKAALVDYEAILAKLIEEEEDYDYWVSNFGKKGFSTYLANQSVKTIEGIVNLNLKKMNTNVSVLIQGFTILKTGEVREKINIFILKNGVSKGIFQRYSGGEKGRINIAGIVGIQRLINLSAKNGGLNFLGLDETFDEIDGTGQREVFNILNNTGVTTLIISQKNNIGAANELVVEKINGISTIRNA